MKQPYNRFSNEEYEKVPQENKEIADDFLLSLKGEKTQQTIRVYTNNCKIILVIMYRLFKDKKIVELVKKDLIKMRVYMLEELKLSTARVNIIYSTLRMMMLFAEVTLSVNHAKVVPMSKETQTTRESRLSNNAFLVELVW